MNEGLTPKQLAGIKKRSRALRIHNIRTRVAISATVIAAAFSGLILVRAEITQLGTSGTAVASASVPAVTYDDSPATTGTAPQAATDPESETDGLPTTDPETTTYPETSTVPSTVPEATPAPAPAPTPPPVVTSQS